MSGPRDVFRAGAPYEAYVGRWSRLVAQTFIPWLELAPRSRWLDVGTGTGMVARTILESQEPDEVIGVDPSDGFLGHARAQTADPRVQFLVGSATELPVDDAWADAAVSGLVLNFVPDAHAAVAEKIRATRPGGVVALYVWDYAERMEFMRHCWDAAAALDARAAELDEGRRFPLCRPGPLQALFEELGLEAVTTRPIDIPTHFRDFDDLWEPFLGGQGAAPSYVATLDDEHRAALREAFRERVPTRPDGSIHLIARAIAVKGRRPRS
jgi:SAM-dependent methyltransferase